MGLNVAWPRPEVYGEGWYNTWGAFIYIGIIAGVGLIWYYTVGRRSIGTLRSHASESVEQAEPDAMATPGPEGI
jgi:hypothetical protein